MEPGAGRGPLAPPPSAAPGEPEDGLPDAGPFTVANALTLARLLLAPVFLLLYVRGQLGAALVAYVLAAATDGLDGLAARLLGQRSWLGRVLDPIADKVLALCALLALGIAGHLPAWLPALVISRDAGVILGAALLRFAGRPVPVQPTRAGKYATFAVAALVVVEILVDAGLLPRAAAAPWIAVAGLLAAECAVISWAQYGVVFARAWRAPRAALAR